MVNLGARLLCLLSLLSAVCSAQSVTELRELSVPASLDLSSDGARLWYKLGQEWWEVGTAPSSKPHRVETHQAAAAGKPPEVQGTPRLASSRRSPDGKRVAYLDAEKPYGPSYLYCFCGQEQSGKPLAVSRMPIFAFQWAKDSNSLWVIASNVADQPLGRLYFDGRFEQLTQNPAMRIMGGLSAAGDVVVWIQSDGSHHGTIWVMDASGKARVLFDPNPQTTKWSEAWTQEVVRWKNAHGEELQGILAAPVGGQHLPLIVDPYSSWQNRFLNIPQMGNYAFVKAGFAIFFPDHRAPHTLPSWAFGDAYVGASKDRDPVDVLTDDVMTGIAELAHRGIVDPDRLFLYSTSNGASAIDQLLTQTHAFRAAVSHGGVSDWLGYYRANQPRGDGTIPGFLGGKKPEDFPELYRRISPVYHADKIATPLLLVVGDKDSIPNGGSRYSDAKAFYEALHKAGSPVDLLVYPGEGHGISGALAEQHVQKAIEFYRSAQPASR
jgi:dipeptidyl aminopeptidase/acylaminoacyl peptidase